MGMYGDVMTFERILDDMLERIPDTVDKREGSVIYDALAPAAAELAKMYIDLDVVMDETFVDTASLQYLMMRCKERGVRIQDATPAVIEGSFTPTTVQLEDGLRFNCDNQNYIITKKIEDGKYQLAAETAGTAGNLYSGSLLPIQYIDGLQTGEITGLLIPGEDGDTADTLRVRYFDSLGGTAFGGNIADYKAKMDIIEGVGGSKVYPVWAGGGTVKIVIIASDDTAPSEDLILKAQNALDPPSNSGQGVGLAPIGHVVTVAGVENTTIQIKTNLTFAEGWNWETAKNSIEAAVKEYLKSLSHDWADAETTIVRISQIENRLLDLPCTLDVADTVINDVAQNFELSADHIPVLGSIGGIS